MSTKAFDVDQALFETSHTEDIYQFIIEKFNNHHKKIKENLTAMTARRQQNFQKYQNIPFEIGNDSYTLQSIASNYLHAQQLYQSQLQEAINQTQNKIKLKQQEQDHYGTQQKNAESAYNQQQIVIKNLKKELNNCQEKILKLQLPEFDAFGKQIEKSIEIQSKRKEKLKIKIQIQTNQVTLEKLYIVPLNEATIKLQSIKKNLKNLKEQSKVLSGKLQTTANQYKKILQQLSQLGQDIVIKKQPCHEVFISVGPFLSAEKSYTEKEQLISVALAQLKEKINFQQNYPVLQERLNQHIINTSNDLKNLHTHEGFHQAILGFRSDALGRLKKINDKKIIEQDNKIKNMMDSFDIKINRYIMQREHFAWIDKFISALRWFLRLPSQVEQREMAVGIYNRLEDLLNQLNDKTIHRKEFLVQLINQLQEDKASNQARQVKRLLSYFDCELANLLETVDQKANDVAQRETGIMTFTPSPDLNDGLIEHRLVPQHLPTDSHLIPSYAICSYKNDDAFNNTRLLRIALGIETDDQAENDYELLISQNPFKFSVNPFQFSYNNIDDSWTKDNDFGQPSPSAPRLYLS